MSSFFTRSQRVTDDDIENMSVWHILHRLFMRRLLARRPKESLENAMVCQVGWARSRIAEDLLRRSKTNSVDVRCTSHTFRCKMLAAYTQFLRIQWGFGRRRGFAAIGFDRLRRVMGENLSEMLLPIQTDASRGSGLLVSSKHALLMAIL